MAFKRLFNWENIINTNILIPLHAGLELRQAEVNFDAEHNGPVRLSIRAGLRFRTVTQLGKVRADEAQAPEVVRVAINPARDRLAATVAPYLNFEHRERRRFRDLCVVLAREDRAFFHAYILRISLG